MPLDFSNIQPAETTKQECHDSQSGDSQHVSFEIKLGVHWLSRLGIILVLMGLAMGMAFSFPYLNGILIPEVKLLLCGLIGSGMFYGGGKLVERFSLLGRIFQGGGLSVGYLTLFGMFFIPQVQLFDNSFLGWSILLFYIVLMVMTARRIRSFSVTLIALAFGYVTAFYADNLEVSMIASGLLSLLAVLLGRSDDRKWTFLPVAGMLGAAAIQCFWAIKTRFLFGYNSPQETEWTQAIIVWGQFLLFHFATVFPLSKNRPVLIVLNAGLFYGLFHLTHQNELFGLHQPGLIEVLMAQVFLATVLSLYLPERLDLLPRGFILLSEQAVRRLFNIQLALTLVLVGLASLAIFGDTTLTAVLSAEALLFGLISTREELLGKLLKMASYIFLAIAFVSMFVLPWTSGQTWTLLASGVSVFLAALILESLAYREDELFNRVMVTLGGVMAGLITVSNVANEQWETAGLVTMAAASLLCGFIVNQPKYRWIGLGILLLALFRLLTVDLVTLETPYKILVFILSGLVLLGGSYAYNLLAQRTAPVADVAQATAEPVGDLAADLPE